MENINLDSIQYDASTKKISIPVDVLKEIMKRAHMMHRFEDIYDNFILLVE